MSNTVQTFYDTQLTAEVKKYTVDLSAFLPAGGSVVSGSATYSQTFGGAASGTCSVSTTASAATFTSPALSAAGLYTFTLSATLSDSQIRKAYYAIRVDV